MDEKEVRARCVDLAIKFCTAKPFLFESKATEAASEVLKFATQFEEYVMAHQE